MTIRILQILGCLASARAQTQARPCPCDDEALCQPVTSVRSQEIFGFTPGDWKNLDWSRVTSIAWPPGGDDDLLCEAHRHGVRLIMGAPNNVPLSGNETDVAAYVQDLVEKVQDGFYDGVTFDYESPLAAGSPEGSTYVSIIRQAADVLRVVVPGSQVSVCAAWSPHDIDGRAYDYKSLAEVSDFLYVMGYDTRSQIFDRCLAGANCPAATAERGLQEFLSIGVAPEKLVLGVPWYGYRYPCSAIESKGSKFCEIKDVPFRGVNCSDAAGSEVPFSKIMELVRSGGNITEVRWDYTSQSPFFNAACDDSPVGVCQYWFDDHRSLAQKYSIAAGLGIRGVGPYTFSDLDFSTPVSASDAKLIYGAFDAFLKPPSTSLV